MEPEDISPSTPRFRVRSAVAKFGLVGTVRRGADDEDV